MITYIVQCRIDGGRLIEIGRYWAKSAANAITAAAVTLRDVTGTLDIIATPES